MNKVSLVKVFVSDQDLALKFYVEQLGFVVTEDKKLGAYRWLLVSAPDSVGFALNLEIATTPEERALVGRQAAGQPLLSIATDDCRRDYRAMSARGVAFEGEPVTRPYGTGVMLRDLYGNKIYLNQDA